MKTRRKIWSLPLALVTALLLVGLLGAAVLAQSRNATPRIDPLDNVEVRIGNTIDVDGTDVTAVARVDLAEEITDSTTVTIEDVDHDNDDITPVQNLQMPEQLAVTVMTNNLNRATTALVGTYDAAPPTHMVGYDHDNDDTNDDLQFEVPSAVASWWDGLSQANKADALGLVRGTDDSICENTDNSAFCGDDPDPDAPADAPQIISDYAAIATSGDGDETITRAFHWDMLSAAQMVAVATVAGIEDDQDDETDTDLGVFAGRFKSLNTFQRVTVP